MKKNKLFKYFSDSYQELLKVTWPTRKQLIRDTAIVIVSATFITGVISLIDLGLTKSLEYFIALKG